jgi:hypothetical protein
MAVSPDDIETRFGVELECCIRNTDKCIRPRLENIIEAENDLLNVSSADAFELTSDFKRHFEQYLRNIMMKSASIDYIRKKYRYIGLYEEASEDSRKYIYDLTSKEPISIRLLDGMPRLKLLKDYAIPFVIPDYSVNCYSDTPGELDPISFECVTPILSFHGVPTFKKVCDTLKPLLVFFGLGQPDCFVLNYTMGFHVNTSLFNRKTNKYIDIAENPFLNYLLKNYVKKERDIYQLVRSRERPLNTVNYAPPIYRLVDKHRDSLSILRASNRKSIKKLIKNSVLDEKYSALHKKKPYLLEFRLFQSESNLAKLCKYTHISLDLLHTTLYQVYPLKGEKKVAHRVKHLERTMKHVKLLSNKGRKTIKHSIKAKSKKNRLERSKRRVIYNSEEENVSI